MICTKSLHYHRKNACRQDRRKSTDRIPFVTTYNPHTTYMAEIAHRNWAFLQSKERMARVFNKRPLVAYRRPMNLRDKLVNTNFRIKRDQPSAEDGCKPCNKIKIRLALQRTCRRLGMAFLGFS